MRILIAEDEPVSRRLLQGTLMRWGYEVLSAEDGQQAWELYCNEDAPRLAILDWMMPGMDGTELCKRIRKTENGDFTYIILLTAKEGKDNVIEGLNAGADDYIAKPFDSGELEVRLRAARRIIDLQAKLLDAQEALRLQATHDSLTGLLNRSAILNTLEKELTRAGREGSSVGLMVVDIDHFKQVNDTHGHQAGDTVIREVSRRMSHNVRNYDSVGRYGGEEFLVVLSRMDLNATRGRAEALRQSICGAPIEVGGDTELDVSVSVGVTAIEAPQADWAEHLIHVADSALYEAKDAGRNRVIAKAPDPRQCTPHVA
jgi:diguanylate cyclase (GGDEF)-like protein